MQVIGVGERRYFNGHQEMVIILQGPTGQQYDLPASPEQVGTVLALMEPPQRSAAPAPRPPVPAVVAPALPSDNFASSMLDGDGEEILEPIRLAANPFTPGFGVEDDGSPL